MAKVILTHEVSGLGEAGDVVEVKNGYARNYLVPQGFATPWTRGGQKQVEQIKPRALRVPCTRSRTRRHSRPSSRAARSS